MSSDFETPPFTNVASVYYDASNIVDWGKEYPESGDNTVYRSRYIKFFLYKDSTVTFNKACRIASGTGTGLTVEENTLLANASAVTSASWFEDGFDTWSLKFNETQASGTIRNKYEGEFGGYDIEFGTIESLTTESNYADIADYKSFSQNTLIAIPSTTLFVMSGNKISIPEAYNINNNNYLQLRAIATLLNGTSSQFNVAWDGAYAIIEPGKPYTGTVNSAKLDETTNVRKSNTKFKMGNETFSLNNIYLIGGDANYIQLRDFAQKMSGTASQFNVYWNDVERQVIIEPGKAYTGTVSSYTEVMPNLDSKLFASFSQATYGYDNSKLLYEQNASHINPISIVVGSLPQNADRVTEDWELVYAYKQGDDDAVSNLWYQIFQNGKNIVIAFRGTPGLGRDDDYNEFEDWLASDMAQKNGGYHVQDELVKKSVEQGEISRYLNDHNNKIYITGHSLGGHLALKAYYYIINEGKGELVQKVEIFNSLGISNTIGNDIINLGQKSKVIYNRTSGDIIAYWNGKHGLTCVGEPQITELDSSGFPAHALSNYYPLPVTLRPTKS